MEPRAINVTGRRHDLWFRVTVDRKPIDLPWTNFKIVAILAMYRYVGINNGWVDRGILYQPDEQTARNIYRTKLTIHAKRPDLRKWNFSQNDRDGFYRLLIDPDKIKIAWQKLRDLRDHDLSTVIRAVT
jgi:hypothetical protein